MNSVETNECCNIVGEHKVSNPLVKELLSVACSRVNHANKIGLVSQMVASADLFPHHFWSSTHA